MRWTIDAELKDYEDAILVGKWPGKMVLNCKAVKYCRYGDYICANNRWKRSMAVIERAMVVPTIL